MKHTPWTVSNGVQIDGADGQAIAYLPAERKSNARLIAAAPDMLSVLREVVAALDLGIPPRLETYDAARNVIAKAEGVKRDLTKMEAGE